MPDTLVRPAFRCPWCSSLGDDDPMPAWRIERQGDAVVSWACDAHLGVECSDLQRLDHPTPTVLCVVQNGVSRAQSDSTASDANPDPASRDIRPESSNG